jgi:outer membrane protein assembly factor BamE (lipoprotein component of BamABCDE complex)
MRGSTAVRTIVAAALFSAAIAALSACASNDKVAALKPGMTQAEVVKVLGRPDSVEVASSQTAYKYLKRLFGGFASDHDYIVLFDNDRLVRHGPGTIQPREFRMDTQPLIIRWT